MDKLVIFASENRNLIECDGVKTAILTNGSLALRLTPPAVDVEDDEVMIELLKRMGLGRLNRQDPQGQALTARGSESPQLALTSCGVIHFRISLTNLFLQNWNAY